MLSWTLSPWSGWRPAAALGTLLILVGHSQALSPHQGLGTALCLSPFSSSLCLCLALPALFRVLGAMADARGEFAPPCA